MKYEIDYSAMSPKQKTIRLKDIEKAINAEKLKAKQNGQLMDFHQLKDLYAEQSVLKGTLSGVAYLEYSGVTTKGSDGKATFPHFDKNDLKAIAAIESKVLQDQQKHVEKLMTEMKDKNPKDKKTEDFVNAAKDLLKNPMSPDHQLKYHQKSKGLTDHPAVIAMETFQKNLSIKASQPGYQSYMQEAYSEPSAPNISPAKANAWRSL